MSLNIGTGPGRQSTSVTAGQPASNQAVVGGAVYNSVAPTYSSGQVTQNQSDINGNLKVVEQKIPNYENNTDNIAWTHKRAVATSAGAVTVDRSTALEASTVAKTSNGRLYKSSGRLDATAATGTFYILFIDASGLPADGPVTTFMHALKFVHVNGADQFWDVDIEELGIPFSNGCVVCLSTTEFTKTIAGAFTSSTNLVG